MSRPVNYEGRALIKAAESLALTAYPDPATGGAPWTIGYGHTGPGVYRGLRITREEAERLFEQDLARMADRVERLAPKATDNQFAALVSFAFNLGPAALAGSTLLKLHNAGHYRAAASQFGRWNHAAGRVLRGLTIRRAKEAALYLTP